MGRRLLAALVGAVVLFVWGMVWWMGLPFANETMHAAKHEDELQSSLLSNLDQSGLYVLPFMNDPDDTEAFERRHERGPIAQIYFRREGVPAMAPAVFARGFAVNCVAALFATWLISLAGSASYAKRVTVVFAAGLFAAAAVELPQWVWWHHTPDVHLANCAFHGVGWLLAGLAMAAIHKPAP